MCKDVFVTMNVVQWTTNMFSYLNVISQEVLFCHHSLLNFLLAISKLPITTESPSVLVLNGCVLQHKPSIIRSSLFQYTMHCKV